MKAILESSHEVVVVLNVKELEYVYSMAGNPDAEDLLKVQDINSNVYWCDSIIFEKED